MVSVEPTLITFVGYSSGSPAEEMVAGAHRAIALDVVERARASNAFHQTIVVTNDKELAQQLDASVQVEFDQVESEEVPFHFGERLSNVIAKYNVQKPFYVSRGSIPLLPAQDLSDLARQLSSSTNTVITNNLFSADVVAFTPGEAIKAIDPPAIDNPLAQLLRHQAGLTAISLPRTAATIFDVDTPTDLLALKVHPGIGPHTQRYVGTLDIDLAPLRTAMSFLVDPMAEVLVAGRVGSHLWAQLEKDTACRVRTLSEERGMRADGREERGEVRSILGFYLEQVGVARFFQTLGELGDAAFIDSRVIFHHLRLNPSRSDRFYSDLQQPQKIANPLIHEFTQGAIEAPIPVILGGHSLVAGTLLAIVDAAWLEEDKKAIIDKPR